ncbi:MAG: Phosphorylated carbohydrates phosphatase [Cellulomonadaceae bacterium TMED98]|nr:MAG: Phosphorylated carbohydrates phosphatase [Cellulomonadaceae bacterium TMED98]
MDGTLIDSEPYWLDAEMSLVQSFGGRWTQEQGLTLVGSGLWDSAAALQHAGVDLELREIIDRLSVDVRARLVEHVPWRPGAREMIASMLDAGIPTALVTMSFRENALTISEAISREIGREAFSVVVAGDDVTEPKPNPEPYLTAADHLGIDIAHAVAFEDSVFGAASAYSAGALTIGIPLHIEIPDSYIHVRWDSMEGKTLEDIAAEKAKKDQA